MRPVELFKSTLFIAVKAVNNFLYII